MNDFICIAADIFICMYLTISRTYLPTNLFLDPVLISELGEHILRFLSWCYFHFRSYILKADMLRLKFRLVMSWINWNCLLFCDKKWLSLSSSPTQFYSAGLHLQEWPGGFWGCFISNRKHMSEGTVTQLGIRVWFWMWPWIGCLEDISGTANNFTCGNMKEWRKLLHLWDVEEKPKLWHQSFENLKKKKNEKKITSLAHHSWKSLDAFLHYSQNFLFIFTACSVACFNRDSFPNIWYYENPLTVTFLLQMLFMFSRMFMTLSCVS